MLDFDLDKMLFTIPAEKHDEKEIADLLEVYLTNEGYQVFKFYRAEGVLDCIRDNEISLAILDVMLPDIDGFQLCR